MKILAGILGIIILGMIVKISFGTGETITYNNTKSMNNVIDDNIKIDKTTVSAPIVDNSIGGNGANENTVAVSETARQVHWHIPISYELCGDTTQLNDKGKHGDIHGHNDSKIHLEAMVDTENRIETLGGYFNSTSIQFSKSQIGKYKNGDKCEGSTTAGKVSVIINGEENKEYRNYILNDKDDIKIIFK